MASKVEDLTLNYEENGEQLVRELDKVILSKGSWATVLFRYQDLDRKTGQWGPEKYSIRRYQKTGGDYKPKSKFTISSADQARKIIEALQGWIA